MAARPRGGDWLAEEIGSWRDNGVGVVVSLLESQEERDLNLKAEHDEVERQGLQFLSFPIADRDVPVSKIELSKTLHIMHRELTAGHSVVLHCRQGIGRTGLVAACLLVSEGVDPQEAVERLKAARGVDVPETAQQRSWITGFASTLAATR